MKKKENTYIPLDFATGATAAGSANSTTDSILLLLMNLVELNCQLI